MNGSTLSYRCEVPDSEFATVNGHEFCSRCQTAIADFTEMTDEEIRRYVSSQQGSLCVKIYSDQLQRVKGAKSGLRNHLAVTATATLLALSTESNAQVSDTTRMEQVENTPVAGDIVSVPNVADSATTTSSEGAVVEQEPFPKKRELKKKVFLRTSRREYYVMNRFPFFGSRYLQWRGKW